MYHPETQVRCLPVATLFDLLQDLQLADAEEHLLTGQRFYITPNTIGNLLVINDHGDPVGIIDFAHNGHLDLWSQGQDEIDQK